MSVTSALAHGKLAFSAGLATLAPGFADVVCEVMLGDSTARTIPACWCAS